MSGYTTEEMVAAGGVLWTGKRGETRVYFNSWHSWVGIQIDRSRGLVIAAYVGNRRVPNQMGQRLAKAKLWWDPLNGRLHTPLLTDQRLRYDLDQFGVKADDMVNDLRRQVTARLRRARYLAGNTPPGIPST